MKKILAMILALAVMGTVASCSGIAHTPDDDLSDTVSDETETVSVTMEKNSESVSSPEVDAVEKMDLVNSALKEKGAMGGNDYSFNRKYLDATYNIAYLGKVYDGEIEILPAGTLQDWVENKFLKKSPVEQDAMPVIYQAVHELGITKDQLKALNESRKKLGQYMILSDEYIDSLYIDNEVEMKQELVNPRALYYNGEVYTWDELNTESFASVTSQIPQNVMNAYVDNIIEYIDESGIMSSAEMERYITDNVRNVVD